MAKANLLNTRTANYLDLIGNGRIYRVPAYQRDYSWQEEQWEDLWLDILDLRTNPENSHYMGALVVEGKTDREFLIIDGQQRLATLSLLALAIIQSLNRLADQNVDPASNRERAQSLRTRFIGEKDPASLVESSKLFLNHTDDGFYQDYLVQLRPPLNPRGLPLSNKLLWECFRYFSKKIDELPSEMQAGQPLAALLAEVVGRQLMFILITVDNELNAYTVFETLNARGLELSATDLLKNFLFSRMRTPADLEALQRRWRALIATVTQERFPEFLRYHLLCELPQVRTQRLFKLIRERISSPEDVFALMDALEKRSELFTALSDPNHGYWIENPGARPFIKELALFRVGQMTPLLFAAWEKFQAEDFISVLRMVSVASFRYTIVCSLNTNALEPAYHEAAKAVLEGAAGRPAQVFSILQRVVYVTDDVFKENFARLAIRTGGQRKKLVKYILAKLESDRSGRAVDPDTDPASIEHILPENPQEVWEQMIPREKWEESIYRLGNLTLLSPADNRHIGNADYASKLIAYRNASYVMTADVTDLAPEEWTLEFIRLRQERLASRAVHLWRLDY